MGEKGHCARKWQNEDSEKSSKIPEETQLQAWIFMCQDSGKVSLNKYRWVQWMVRKKQLSEWPIIVTMRFSTEESIVLPFVLIYRPEQGTGEKIGRRMWIMISQGFFFSICSKKRMKSLYGLSDLWTFFFFFFCPSFSKSLAR